MGSTYRFRGSALGRVLEGASVAALAVMSFVLGCGGKVAVDLDGDTIGVGGGGSGGEGGRSAIGGGSGTGSGGVGACKWKTHGVGAGQTKLPECFPMPEKGCPKQYDAPLFIVPSMACVYLVSVDCGPVQTSGSCCYMVTEEEKGCN